MARATSALIHNWRLKLSALGLAVFLWALVQTEPLSQETFSAVPVELEIADTSWTTAGAPSPATVELRLGGPAREIIRLAREGIRLRVPVDAVGSRDTLISLQREWVELGPVAGVTVESVSPSTLAVSFEPAITRTLPLSPRLRGQLPAHLALSRQLAISPEVVQVRGPESRVRGLDSISLLPFDLGGVDESDGYTLTVDTAGLAGASVVPASAMLGVRVEPWEERVLDRVTVLADLGTGAGALVVEPESVHLRLAGARSLLSAMDLYLVRVSVEPDAVRDMQEREERRVRLQIDGVPPLVTVTPTPEVVTVRRVSDLTDSTERNRP